LDSGVLHFAMALDKPTVSLFRDSEGHPGWAPRGEQHRVLLRDCSCNQTGKAACSGSRALCLSKITPTEVAQAALSVLPMSGKG
jgi:ADP-heptose:LPS heptosyltransferase